MVRKQFFIREDQQKRLKAVAAAKGVSEAELIRQGIDLELKRNEAAENESWKEGFRQAAGIWKDRTDLDELFADARRRRKERRKKMDARMGK